METYSLRHLQRFHPAVMNSVFWQAGKLWPKYSCIPLLHVSSCIYVFKAVFMYWRETWIHHVGLKGCGFAYLCICTIVYLREIWIVCNKLRGQNGRLGIFGPNIEAVTQDSTSPYYSVEEHKGYSSCQVMGSPIQPRGTCTSLWGVRFHIFKLLQCQRGEKGKKKIKWKKWKKGGN